VIGEDEQIGARLAGRVGARGREDGVLAERAPLDRAVDLVRGDLQVAADAQLAYGLEERVRAEHVGADEVLRVADGTVDVSLGREVDDGVGAGEGRAHDTGVADVPAHERVARVALDVAQVLEVAGVGEFVEVDDLDVLMGAQQVTDEVRADEPGAAGDKDVLWHESSGFVRHELHEFYGLHGIYK